MEVREPSAKYLTKPAYKQTEVGTIPEDWEVRQIGNFQPFVTSGSRGWAAYYSEVGSPFVRITNLSRECIYPDLRDLRFVAIPEGDTEGDRTQLEDGDVLISITADIGIVGYVTNQIPKPAYINQHIALVRFDPSQTCPHFISYFLASSSSQKLFRALTDSGAKAGMNLVTVKQIRLALPPTVAEQQAIAEALGDAHALIESLEQLLAKKRQIKQGAMQELLTGQKRLPGFAGEWHTKSLRELFDFGGGFTASRDQLGTDGYCYLHYGDIHTSNKTYVDVGAEFQEIPKLDVPLKKVRSASLLDDGDVVFVDASEDDEGTSKHVVVVKPDDVPFISGLHTIVAKSKTGEMENLYKRYCFQASSVKAQFRFFAVGTKVSGISKSNIRKITVSVPPVDEQTAIATLLSDMDAEIAAHEAKLAKARNLKQGMMQELLTGRIRLVQPKAKIIPFPAQVDAKSEKVRPLNRQIEEAVALGVLAKAFGSEQHPLARVRRTKLLYLLHRHVEGSAEGYLKKAAGPYNPKTRYQGPERIALKNGYVRAHNNGTYEGFVAGDKIADADTYFDKWHEPAVRLWLEQFHYTKTEELELLATVDMAMEDLRREDKEPTLATVKQIIQSDPEWRAKLAREVFSDTNIERAITKCHNLFGN